MWLSSVISFNIGLQLGFVWVKLDTWLAVYDLFLLIIPSFRIKPIYDLHIGDIKLAADVSTWMLVCSINDVGCAWLCCLSLVVLFCFFFFWCFYISSCYVEVIITWPSYFSRDMSHYPSIHFFMARSSIKRTQFNQLLVYGPLSALGTCYITCVQVW